MIVPEPLIWLMIVPPYLLAQTGVPILAYKLAKRGGQSDKAANLFALGGFLLVFLPVWHKQIPAMIVYARLTRDSGTGIHKPIEQWVAENPGVLQTLEPWYPWHSDRKRPTGRDGSPNSRLDYQGHSLQLKMAYLADGKQRIGWYEGWEHPVRGRVSQRFDVFYDIEKKEVLVEASSALIVHFGNTGLVHSHENRTQARNFRWYLATFESKKE